MSAFTQSHVLPPALRQQILQQAQRRQQEANRIQTAAQARRDLIEAAAIARSNQEEAAREAEAARVLQEQAAREAATQLALNAVQLEMLRENVLNDLTGKLGEVGNEKFQAWLEKWDPRFVALNAPKKSLTLAQVEARRRALHNLPALLKIYRSGITTRCR